MTHNTDTLRATLTEMLSTLTTELGAIGIHDPHNPQDWVAIPEVSDRHESDADLVADSVEAWDERRALVASLERQFNDITRALRKIDTGTYGTCEICGAQIEMERLAANPSARTDKAHMDEEETLPI